MEPVVGARGWIQKLEPGEPRVGASWLEVKLGVGARPQGLEPGGGKGWENGLEPRVGA